MSGNNNRTTSTTTSVADRDPTTSEHSYIVATTPKVSEARSKPIKEPMKAHPSQPRDTHEALPAPKKGSHKTEGTVPSRPKMKNSHVGVHPLPDKGLSYSCATTPCPNKKNANQTKLTHMHQGTRNYPQNSKFTRTDETIQKKQQIHTHHAKKTKIPIKIKHNTGQTLRYSRKTTKIPIRLTPANNKTKNDQIWSTGSKEATYKPNTANKNTTQKNLFSFSKNYYNSRTKERVKQRAHKTVKVQTIKKKNGPTKRVKPASNISIYGKTNTLTPFRLDKPNKKTSNKISPKTINTKVSQHQASTPINTTTKSNSIVNYEKINQTPTKTRLNIRKFQIKLTENKATKNLINTHPNLKSKTNKNELKTTLHSPKQNDSDNYTEKSTFKSYELKEQTSDSQDHKLPEKLNEQTYDSQTHTHVEKLNVQNSASQIHKQVAKLKNQTFDSQKHKPVEKLIKHTIDSQIQKPTEKLNEQTLDSGILKLAVKQNEQSSDSQIQNLPEKPNDQISDSQTRKPVEKLEEQTMDSQTHKQVEKLNEQSLDSHIYKPVGKLNEQTPDSQIMKLAEKLNEQTPDSQIYKPVGKLVEKLNEQTTDSQTHIHEQKLRNQTNDIQACKLTETSNEQTADSQKQKLVEKPSEQTSDSRTLRIAGKPNEQSSDSQEHKIVDTPNKQTSDSLILKVDSQTHKQAEKLNKQSTDRQRHKHLEKPNEHNFDSRIHNQRDTLNEQNFDSQTHKTTEKPERTHTIGSDCPYDSSETDPRIVIRNPLSKNKARPKSPEQKLTVGKISETIKIRPDTNKIDQTPTGTNKKNKLTLEALRAAIKIQSQLRTTRNLQTKPEPITNENQTKTTSTVTQQDEKIADIKMKTVKATKPKKQSLITDHTLSKPRPTNKEQSANHQEEQDISPDKKEHIIPDRIPSVTPSQEYIHQEAALKSQEEKEAGKVHKKRIASKRKRNISKKQRKMRENSHPTSTQTLPTTKTSTSEPKSTHSQSDKTLPLQQPNVPTPPNPSYTGLTKNQKRKLRRKKSKPINNNIRVTHINQQHSHNSSLTLAENLETFYDPSIPHIVKIMEPLCSKKGKLLDIPKNYKCFIKSNTEQSPRAAILVSENIEQKVMFHDSLTDRDNCTISIKDHKDPCKRQYINANYLPYEEKVENNLLKTIMEYTNETGNGLITGSDTNCQSTLWGNNKTNSRGKELETLLNDMNINIENTTYSPTWQSRGMQSTIDLTLTNGNAPNITNWQILQGVSESDHSYITYEIEHKKNITDQPYSKKINWQLFEQSLKAARDDCSRTTNRHSNDRKIAKDRNDIEKWTKNLNEDFRTAIETATVKYRKEVISKTEKILTSLKNLTSENKNKFCPNKKKRPNKKNKTLLIKRARQTAWKNFCSQIENTKDTARIKKILTTTSLPRLGNMKLADGKLTNSPKESLNRLADGLLGPDKINNDDYTSKPCPVKNTTNLDNIINETRLAKILKQLKKNKAPGTDQITNEMIIYGFEHIKDDLIKIFKSCLKHGHTPKPWRTANAAIIPKPGKTDYAEVKSYRIISLSSNLLKILESLVLWHLKKDLNMETSLNQRQYGFRPGSSTDAALLKVINKIQTHLKANEHVIGVFIDIQGAFDNLPHRAIKKALENTPAKGEISNWIMNMVTNRDINLSLAEETINRKISKGCPQGGVLSPFLWNLVMDNLLTNNEQFKNIFAYADDILIIQAGHDIKTVTETMERHIEKVIKWCSNQGLEISAPKTEILCWTNKPEHKPKKLKIDNQEKELTTQTKYLGLLIDDQLKWDDHITKRVAKCKKIFFACKAAIGKKWGLDKNKIMWIYKTVILPTLTYGAIVWGPYLTNKQIKKIEPLQNLITKIYLGALKSTPKYAQNILCNLLSPENQIRSTSLQRAITLKAEGHWEQKQDTAKNKKIVPIMQKIDNLLYGILKGNTSVDLTSPHLNINKKIDFHIPTRSNFKVTQNQDVIIGYTDGSKDEKGNTGFGFHIIDPREGSGYSEHGKLNNENSVFQAETFAIDRLALHLLDKDTHNKNIIIYSDSQAAIRALDKTMIKHTTVKTCHENLTKLTDKGNKVTVSWIPGHRGHDGNELADALAKMGTESPKLFNHIKTPALTIKLLILRHYKKETLAEFYLKPKLSEECLKPMKAFLQHHKKITKEIQHLNKQDTAILTKILTGHNNLNNHAYRAKLADSPKCDYCEDIEENETAMHILLDCAAFTEERQYTFGKPTLSLEELLKNKDTKKHITKNIIKFFKKSEILTKRRDLPASPRH